MHIDDPSLSHVTTDLVYTRRSHASGQIRVFPPSSGRLMERPERERHTMPVFDCRPIAGQLTLDDAGFAFLPHVTTLTDFYDAERVRKDYYPETAALLKQVTGALDVFIFDHNVRSRARSDRGQAGVREPVEGAHNDYTLSSGPRRVREVLEDNNATHLEGHRAALINVWRPIIGPVQDHPLAVCDARSAKLDDFLPTTIEHYSEDNLETPSLTGQVYSFQHNPGHRWYYVSDMCPDEVMFLKCFDSADDGRACFTGHTGFINPDCPAEYTPRESIEARTLVIYP